jgi:hypothetical protein
VAAATGTKRQRRSDIELIAFSAFLVVAAVGLLAWGFVTATSSDDTPTCGRLPMGSVDDIRNQLENSAPYFRTGGGDCGFWLALDGGDIVAYQLHVPGRDCTVRYEGDGFHCGNEPIATSDLETYPTTIETVDNVDSLVVDLRSPEDRRRATTST